MAEQKKVLLDTGVLLRDPNSLFKFPGSRVFIPVSVIEEIDKFTKFADESGRNARKLLKELDSLKVSADPRTGTQLPNNSELTLLVQSKAHPSLPEFSDLSKNSNRTLSAAFDLSDLFPGETFTLLTNDLNLRVRAHALGIHTEDFTEVKSPSPMDQTLKLELPEEDLRRLLERWELDFADRGAFANQHFLVDYEPPILVRYHAKEQKLKMIDDYSDGVWGIRPKNPEQKLALDVLMDPEIRLVILTGKAGTGKTLLAMASALEQMLTRSEYSKILISRPIVPMGKDLGYLPGGIDEKLAPWMQPIFDNLEFLTGEDNQSGKNSVNSLTEKKLVEIEPLTYIRGRSISNRFMIVDEAQNLTPHEVKTIVSRAGENSKFVLNGDPFQIDNPYVNETSNGLVYVKSAMKGHSIVASVHLVKGERSRLAELAANTL